MKKIDLTTYLLIAVVLIASLGVFAEVMITWNHNEHMYLATSVLIAQGKTPYKDFGLTETPYLPEFYGGLFKLLHIGSYYLLICKWISFLAIAAAAIALFLITRRVSNNTASSLGIVALFLLNTDIIEPASQISNHTIPLTLTFVSFYLFVISLGENRTKPLGIAVAGLLLTLAMGIRLTYATVIIPFVIIGLMYSLVSRQPPMTIKTMITHVLLPFAAGGIVGLLPMLFFLSDWHSFLFNNLSFHFLNGNWSQMTGYSTNISLLEKISFAHDMFFQVNSLILIVGILVALGLSAKELRINKLTIEKSRLGAVLAFLLVLVSIPTTLAATPSWPEYYAMPISFLLILLIYVCAPEAPSVSPIYRRLLLILVLVSVVYNGPSLVASIDRLGNRNNWAALSIHDVAINIRNALPAEDIGNDKKIATLSPAYAVEANLPIYLELGAGPFTYRLGDLLSPEQRKEFVVASPKTIAKLFNKEPPAAIFVGFEGELDEPLVQYAVSHDYRKVDAYFGGGELYVLDMETGLP